MSVKECTQDDLSLDLLVLLKEKKDMTLTELSLFRGSKDSAGLIYVACKGDIFDLTESRKIFTWLNDIILFVFQNL